MNTQTALHKVNWIYPLRWQNGSYDTATLLRRYHAAVRHLAETHKGSLYVDPNYGSTFYRMRTQGMDEDSGTVEMEEFIAAAARYIPDLVFPREAQSVIRDQDNQTQSIRLLWLVGGAVPEIHGDLGRPQTTTVQT